MKIKPFVLFLIALCLLTFGGIGIAADEPADADGNDPTSRYTVKFVGKSLAAALGPKTRVGRSHTRNAAGRPVLDVRAPASVEFLDKLRRNQDRRVQAIESLLGRTVAIQHRFDVVLNGVMVELTADEAERVATLPFVEFVERERIDQLATFAGPDWIGADSIWDGSATVSGLGNRGEGMIAGVVDSGINTQSHPSFSDVDDEGYAFTNPLGAGVFLGDCIGGTSGNDIVQCNDKLIGAYGFAGGTPEDTQANVGHGSHVASTMAGNVVEGPFSTVNNGVFEAARVAGVAPRASIIAYRGCASGCPSSATGASLQQALIDGVTAVNYSIGPTVGGRGISPWSSQSERIMLDLVAAGVFVAASAGNTSPSFNPRPEADVANKAPWIATVANSSHGGFVAHQSTFTDGAVVGEGLENVLSIPGTGPEIAADIDAPAFSAVLTDSANAEGCDPWSGTPFTGGVLVVSRGTCNFSVKVDNAAAAGAIAAIVHNNDDAPPEGMGGLESTTIPAVMIPLDEGLAANAFIDDAPNARVTLPAALETVLVRRFGNELSPGSLIGPNLDFDVTEPTINGPGRLILAANATGGAPFRFLSGTSMSSPHVAGAGLLLMAEHPDWTPTEVLSAMMLTADPVGTDAAGNPTNPDDVGSGTVDLTRASLSGLILSETFEAFLAANPATGGDPRTLNLPSMRHTACDPGCSWTRTVRAARDFPTSWTAQASGDGFDVSISPENFELLEADVLFRDGAETDGGPNSSAQEIEITVSNNTSGSQMRFGELVLSEDSDQTPEARMTISVSQSLPAPPPI